MMPVWSTKFLTRSLEAKGIPVKLVNCDSKKGYIHVFLYTVPTDALQEKVHEALEAHGHTDLARTAAIARSGMEVFFMHRSHLRHTGLESNEEEAEHVKELLEEQGYKVRGVRYSARRERIEVWVEPNAHHPSEIYDLLQKNGYMDMSGSVQNEPFSPNLSWSSPSPPPEFSQFVPSQPGSLYAGVERPSSLSFYEAAQREIFISYIRGELLEEP